MDGSRFDAWTRRGFGLAGGGLALTLLGLARTEDVEAKKGKKGKKPKRCKKVGTGCNPGSKRKCCKGAACQQVPSLGGNRCCLTTDGAPCISPSNCCSGFCLDDQCQPAFCKEITQPCLTNEECCSKNCIANSCGPEL